MSTVTAVVLIRFTRPGGQKLSMKTQAWTVRNGELGDQDVDEILARTVELAAGDPAVKSGGFTAAHANVLCWQIFEGKAIRSSPTIT